MMEFVRNRKKYSYRHNVRTERREVGGRAFSLMLAVILGIVLVSGLAYLWVDGQCTDLGQQIKRLESVNADLQRRIVNEEFKWANLTAPASIQKLLIRQGLNMELPKDRSIVRVRRAGAWLERYHSGSAVAQRPNHETAD